MKKNNYTPQLSEEKINKLVKELSNPKLIPIPYLHYQKTEEWAIIERLLKELENNEDIEIRTPSEYVIGYIVRELRNKDLSLLANGNSKLGINTRKSNGRLKKHL